MARPPGNRPTPPKPRTTRPPVAAPAGGAVAATATADAPKKKVSVGQFFREVRAEMRKITWTSRKETTITSVFVFIMVIVTALFFWVADLLLSGGVHGILQLANPGT